MTLLSKLIDKYGSDKNLSEYTPFYSLLFANIRLNRMNVLEIGIGTMDKTLKDNFAGNMKRNPHYKPGGSLRAWRDYFRNSKIYGIDIGEDCIFEEERIKTWKCDSTDSDAVDLLFGDMKFDIIIDDGLHTPQGQLQTMANFYNRLQPDGIYIVEDTGRDGLWTEENIAKVRKIANGRRAIFKNMRSNLLIIKRIKK